jgi:hypothetical protein
LSEFLFLSVDFFSVTDFDYHDAQITVLYVVASAFYIAVAVLQNFTAERTVNQALILLSVAGSAALILPRWVAVALLDRVSGFF